MFFKQTFLLLLVVSMSIQSKAQFGYGFTASNDLYHRYVNPETPGIEASAGSAILNLGIGPKMWIGSKKFSFSAEGQVVMGFLGVSSSENKGLGTVAFPFLGKFNFGGLSTFDKEGKMGFSLGGGFQFNRTEAYGLNDKYASQGYSRKYFTTYVVQAGYGFGLSGFTLQGIIRYGYNPDDNNSNTLNIGLQYDFNVPMLKKITSPESEL